jgi:hypothetical protein
MTDVSFQKTARYRNGAGMSAVKIVQTARRQRKQLALILNALTRGFPEAESYAPAKSMTTVRGAAFVLRTAA